MDQTQAGAWAKANPVQNNIQAISEMQEHLEERRGIIERTADVIAGFSGSMGFVLVHIIWFVV